MFLLRLFHNIVPDKDGICDIARCKYGVYERTFWSYVLKLRVNLIIAKPIIIRNCIQATKKKKKKKS